MSNERNYNKPIVHGISTADLNTIFIPVDCNTWSSQRILSLQELSDLLADRNLKGAGNVINLVPDISLLPEKLEIKPAYIAISDNYMYVWVDNKWKKIPMLDV